MYYYSAELGASARLQIEHQSTVGREFPAIFTVALATIVLPISRNTHTHSESKREQEGQEKERESRDNRGTTSKALDCFP